MNVVPLPTKPPRPPDLIEGTEEWHQYFSSRRIVIADIIARIPTRPLKLKDRIIMDRLIDLAVKLEQMELDWAGPEELGDYPRLLNLFYRGLAKFR